MLGGLGADPARIHQIVEVHFGGAAAGGPDREKKASRVRIDIRGPQASKSDPIGVKSLPGLKYLAFKTESRYYYDPDDRSALTFTLRCQDTDDLAMFWSGLWLLNRFGGLGARSRRGMGGFQIEILDSDGAPAGLPPLAPESAGNARELASNLATGLNLISAYLAQKAGGSLGFQTGATVPAFGNSNLPEFSCFSPGFWRASVWSPGSSGWRGALDELGDRYHQYRLDGRLSRDYKAASDYEATGRASRSDLAALGLPLVFRFTHPPHQGARVEVRGSTGRRASPLFLRILRNAAGDYFCLAHFFKCKLVEPDRLQFYMSKPATPARWQRPSANFPVDWTVAEGFLQSVSSGNNVYV